MGFEIAAAVCIAPEAREALTKERPELWGSSTQASAHAHRRRAPRAWLRPP